MKIKTSRNLVLAAAAMVLTALVVHAQSYHCAQGINTILRTGCVAAWTYTNGVCAYGHCDQTEDRDAEFNGNIVSHTRCDVSSTGLGRNYDVTKITNHDWWFHYHADNTPCGAPCCGCPLGDNPSPIDDTWCDQQFDQFCANAY